MTSLSVRNNQLDSIASKCIHCGLCLEDCPTYLELGNEMDSPRGRILLMRAITSDESAPGAQAIKHLDRCLDCRACEAVCPSGVHYSELLEGTRAMLRERSSGDTSVASKHWQLLLVRFVLPHRGRLRAALRMQRFATRIGLMELARRLFPGLQRMTAITERGEASTTALRRSVFEPPQRATVSLFVGCATAEMTPRTLDATRQVLEVNGCVAACTRGQRCCGALHAHMGDMDGARALALANLAAFTEDTPIVSFAAGCGAMLKDYPRLFTNDERNRGRAERFASRVQDISQYLMSLGLRTPTHAVPMRVTYHDACHHAHAQGIRATPRELLRAIPGLTLIESAESAMCCGAAGSYNLTQPEIAARLAKRKVANLAATNAAIIATGNIGCILHLRANLGEKQRIVHFIELLHAAYGLAPSNDVDASDAR